MTLRSSSRVEYWARILFLVLFSLAVYVVVAAYLGWQDVFAFWKPERMRWFLVMGVVWAVAAREMRIARDAPHRRTCAPPTAGKDSAEASAPLKKDAEARDFLEESGEQVQRR